MTLTIELPTEIETRVQRAAARRGVNASRYVVEALEEHFRESGETPTHLAKAESDLLQQINLGLHESSWHRYHQLIEERRAETLSPEGQAELIALSDQIEEANVRRVQALIDLARIRRISVTDLMESLGIAALDYG